VPLPTAAPTLLEDLLGTLASGSAGGFELLSLLVIVVDEEMLNLLGDRVRQVTKLEWEKRRSGNR